MEQLQFSQIMDGELAVALVSTISVVGSVWCSELHHSEWGTFLVALHLLLTPFWNDDTFRTQCSTHLCICEHCGGNHMFLWSSPFIWFAVLDCWEFLHRTAVVNACIAGLQYACSSIRDVLQLAGQTLPWHSVPGFQGLQSSNCNCHSMLPLHLWADFATLQIVSGPAPIPTATPCHKDHSGLCKWV